MCIRDSKSNFGNIGPATSIVELIGGVLAKQNGLIPPTINCEKVDPSCGVNVINKETPLSPSAKMLKSSFSVTGQIASVVIT